VPGPAGPPPVGRRANIAHVSPGLDLDALRRDGEAFQSAYEEAWYRHSAGLSDGLDLAPLYERHADLFEEGTVRPLLDAARNGHSGDRSRSLRALGRFAADGLIGRETREATESLARAEATAMITIDGAPVAWRAAAGLIANEPDAERRATIDRLRLQTQDRELNPLQAGIWERSHAVALELGAASYRDLYERLSGVDFDGLHRQCRGLLADTEELYERSMDAMLRGQVGRGLGEAGHADLPRAFRAVEFDEHFKAERMVPALARTLEGLGIDLHAQANVVLDLEPRPRKTPRAFCAPVRVPERVYLVVSPIGGVDDYRALFHEAGHAEHFAGASPALPFEFRYLGDNAITECYAFLFEGLVHDPAWLERMLGQRDLDAYRRQTAAQRLYFLRRYSAKLGYELGFHGPGPLEGQADRYESLLSEALRIPWPRARWLSDIDEGFYAVNYLRAWSLEASLREHLRERFGSRWFAERRAGGFLRELFAEGQRYGAAELAGELGLPQPDLGLLVAESHEQLA